MAKTTETVEMQMETSEYLWKIPHWASRCSHKNFIESRNCKFEPTGFNKVETKWSVGFVVYDDDSVELYWKLTEMKGSTGKLRVQLFSALKSSNGTYFGDFLKEETVSVSNQITNDQSIWDMDLVNDKYLKERIHSDGSITILLRLTIFTPKLETNENILTSLLRDLSHADVILETNDKKKIRAHKAILAVRCAYFDTMFQSECKEINTYTVKIDDVSVKTLKILLHYWYTGKLLPSWQDKDTIVEFINKAGKYKITEILEILNETIGKAQSEKYSKQRIELLESVHKLSLKSAEERLLTQIKQSLNKVKSAEELFALLNIKDRVLSEANDPRTAKALEMLNTVLNEKDNIDVSYRHVRLLCLLQQQSFKTLEEKLLAKIVKTTKKVESVEELFALYGFEQKHKSKDEGLLVRTLPDKQCFELKH